MGVKLGKNKKIQVNRPYLLIMLANVKKKLT